MKLAIFAAALVTAAPALAQHDSQQAANDAARVYSQITSGSLPGGYHTGAINADGTVHQFYDFGDHDYTVRPACPVCDEEFHKLFPEHDVPIVGVPQ